MTSPAPGPGTLRERKKQRVREEIYNAALDLLAEQPYDKVSVDDICARAQVGRATFFRFYGTKAGLLAEFNRRLAELPHASRIRWEQRRAKLAGFRAGWDFYRKNNDAQPGWLSPSSLT